LKKNYIWRYVNKKRLNMSCGSSVGIANGYRLDSREV
jgi:hypothetical protein